MKNSNKKRKINKKHPKTKFIEKNNSHLRKEK